MTARPPRASLFQWHVTWPIQDARSAFAYMLYEAGVPAYMLVTPGIAQSMLRRAEYELKTQFTEAPAAVLRQWARECRDWFED